MGVMLSAGGSFRWYRDALASNESYDALTQAAAAVASGSEGLLFLPYLTGERTPHPDPHARGAFIGLSIRHAKPHLTRAVIEGVTFGLRDSLELMRALGVSTQQVRASGGGAKSALWRQMLADIFNAEIVTVNSAEGAAYGAALLAGVGSGIYPSVEAAADRAIRITGAHQPGREASVYAGYYARYQALYPALKAEFAALAKMVSF
jgi:xylulokinase